MSTLERLKILYKERYREHHDIDAWNEAIEKEWPKLLAFVEAFDSYAFDLKDENFRDLADARKALDLDEEPK